MERVTKKDINKLAKNPMFFAMMMDESELEHVIVTFVSVFNKRKNGRGGENYQ